MSIVRLIAVGMLIANAQPGIAGDDVISFKYSGGWGFPKYVLEVSGFSRYKIEKTEKRGETLRGSGRLSVLEAKNAWFLANRAMKTTERSRVPAAYCADDPWIQVTVSIAEADLKASHRFSATNQCTGASTNWFEFGRYLERISRSVAAICGDGT